MAGPVTRGAISNPDRRIWSYSNEIPSRGAGGGRVSRLGGGYYGLYRGNQARPGRWKVCCHPKEQPNPGRSALAGARGRDWRPEHRDRERYPPKGAAAALNNFYLIRIKSQRSISYTRCILFWLYLRI